MRGVGKLLAWGWTLLALLFISWLAEAATVVEDVFIRASPVAAYKSWQRIEVGGLADGAGYFARAVADTAQGPGAGSDSAEELLWTFTDDELGQARSKPRIALTNAEDGIGGNEWAALFGGGYSAAKLFVVFIDRGIDGWSSSDFVKVSTVAPEPPLEGEPAPFSNRLGEAALLDTDLNGTADRAYAGDLLGNLYRFDLGGSDPSAWHALRLFQATHGEQEAIGQPIVARPLVLAHPSGDGFLVVFATAGGLVEREPAHSDVRSIYGIWDTGEADPATAHPDAKREHLALRALVDGSDESATGLEAHPMIAGDPLHDAPDASGRASVHGWYIDIEGGDLADALGEPGLVFNADGTVDLVFGNGATALAMHLGGAGGARTGRLSWRELPETPP